jgi:uncharacterized protein
LIAVDTNILVYVHREDSPFHQRAMRALVDLDQGPPWAVPWPCVHEFYGVITHPRMYNPPTSVDVALRAVTGLIEADGMVIIGEANRHWQTLRSLLERGQIVGPMVHDARIAAICLEHGVRELWSADRDFSRFPALKVVNPLVG